MKNLKRFITLVLIAVSVISCYGQQTSKIQLSGHDTLVLVPASSVRAANFVKTMNDEGKQIIDSMTREISSLKLLRDTLMAQNGTFKDIIATRNKTVQDQRVVISSQKSTIAAQNSSLAKRNGVIIVLAIISGIEALVILF